ncbi:MAG TPA: hypothetical protein VMU09_04135 [Acidimicrobiales bacterium]|nr:hypothetical protein [Acidimicrobiales bacterium]
MGPSDDWAQTWVQIVASAALWVASYFVGRRHGRKREERNWSDDR